MANKSTYFWLNGPIEINLDDRLTAVTLSVLLSVGYAFHCIITVFWQ